MTTPTPDDERPADAGIGTVMEIGDEYDHVPFLLTLGRRGDSATTCLATIAGKEIASAIPNDRANVGFREQRKSIFLQWLAQSGVGIDVDLATAQMEQVFQAEVVSSRIRLFKRRYCAAATDEEPELEIFGSDSLADESLFPIVGGILWDGLLAGFFAPEKMGKTHAMVDLALSVSLGRGGLFLGRFPVRSKRRPLLISPESGGGLLTEIVAKVSDAKRIGDNECLWSTSAIRLDRPRHLDALGNHIEREGVGLLLIDSVFRMMEAAQASSLSVGRVLADMMQMCQAHDCTPIISHHCIDIRKYRPGRLSDVSWAGFSECVRSWMILTDRGRRVEGVPRPFYLSYGSTATADEVWQADVDFQHWQWTTAGQSSEGCMASKKLQADRGRIIATATRFPQGESNRTIMRESGLRQAAFNAALGSLLADGSLVPADIYKGKRKTPYQGYRLRGQAPHRNTNDNTDNKQ